MTTSTAVWRVALDRVYARIDQTIDTVNSGFPHYADESTGIWTTSPGGDWTGGFWNGMLWQAYAATGRPHYGDAARRYAEKLRPRVESETVFLGFLFYYGAALGWLRCGDTAARDLAVSGARALAAMYNDVARVIPLGAQAEEASDVGRNEANIDGVPGGVPLLHWAAGEIGNGRLVTIATEHALRHIELCVRDDGSVCQSASFDPRSGEVIRRYTHKGLTDDSTWTRAQAWAMLGYAAAATSSPDRSEFSEVAFRVADWWIDHVPADAVAYWDFNAQPQPETARDTSGTAIAAAALLKLAELTPDPGQHHRFRTHAIRTVGELVNTYLTPVDDTDGRPPGILTQGCYNHRISLAVNNELIWGDYFLLEALLVLVNDSNATDF